MTRNTLLRKSRANHVLKSVKDLTDICKKSLIAKIYKLKGLIARKRKNRDSIAKFKKFRGRPYKKATLLRKSRAKHVLKSVKDLTDV